MAILSKVCRPDNFESHNSLKLSFMNIQGLHSNFVYCESFLEKKNFMAPFYGWSSTASRPEPLRGGSLLFTAKFPETPSNSPDILALCETNLDDSIDSGNFSWEVIFKQNKTKQSQMKPAEFSQHWNQQAASYPSPYCLVEQIQVQKPIQVVATYQMPGHS